LILLENISPNCFLPTKTQLNEITGHEHRHFIG
jgi:hypothetical protein